MKNLTLRNLTKVCNGIWHGDNALLDQEISAITTDSRKIEKDCLFVPHFPSENCRRLTMHIFR